MQAARKRHLDKQLAVDTVNLLREGQDIDIWAFGMDGKAAQYQVVPFAETEPHEGQLVLCWYGQRLRVMTYIEHGLVVSHDRRGYVEQKQILGKVVKEISSVRDV
jgi:hypothetical protein